MKINKYRTIMISDIEYDMVGQEIIVIGWVQNIRDHGGMALGIDRILMIIKDESNLREVQAFPVSTSGQDLMMGSPSVLEPKQLEELGIKIKEE